MPPPVNMLGPIWQWLRLYLCFAWLHVLYIQCMPCRHSSGSGVLHSLKALHLRCCVRAALCSASASCPMHPAGLHNSLRNCQLLVPLWLV
jgi:hypothetical protein